jgi:aminomethyltransferase
MASFPFGGGTLTVSRTGFTGDLGYELWTTPDHALTLWDHLFAAGRDYGIRPIGSNALNTARIEAGFIITNLDFIPSYQAVREDRVRSPFEIGLEWLIDWDKGHFTGRRALLAERNGGTSKWALVGLDIEGNVSAQGSLLYHNKKHEAGFITAATWSPTLKRSIALAQVERRHMGVDNLWVEIYALRELQYMKLMLPVTLAERPFFFPDRRRATPPGKF